MSFFATIYSAIIHWGYDNIERSKQWVGPDGTINIQPMQPGTGARIILYPHTQGPTVGANAEVTIYGKSDQAEGHPETNFERFSMTQMCDRERNVRFSMEKGGTGQFRELWFGYDTFQPGKAYFPLRICPGSPTRPRGVYVVDLDGNYTRIGG